MESRNFSVFPKCLLKHVMTLSILGDLTLKLIALWNSRKTIMVPI